MTEDHDIIFAASVVYRIRRRTVIRHTIISLSIALSLSGTQLLLGVQSFFWLTVPVGFILFDVIDLLLLRKRMQGGNYPSEAEWIEAADTLISGK